MRSNPGQTRRLTQMKQPPANPGHVHRSLQTPTTLFGVEFKNRLGLAAGLDRTGRLVGERSKTGIGHIEIGTITNHADLERQRADSPRRVRVGISIASSRAGLDKDVVEDYARLSRKLSRWCDFLVVNLSSPHHARDGNTPGIKCLVHALMAERYTHQQSHHVPLLMKVAISGGTVHLPDAVRIARDMTLDAVIVATPCLHVLEHATRLLDNTPVISVGGIKTIDDATRRLEVGAALVQIHSAYAQRGCAAIAELLQS